LAPAALITKQITVNGNGYKVILTDQVIAYVNTLKKLYEITAYEDPETFEQVSSEIAATVGEIATAIDPPAEEGDLDGIIQEIIRSVDSRAAEMEQQLSKSKRTR